MGWIGCVRCDKFRCDFVARNFALIAPVQPILYQASWSNETIQNTPKHFETQQYICCEKFQNDFTAQTCALIAPVQPVLHRVSCSNVILPNAPKHYEMHTNMSLGSNGVGRVHLLRKIPKRIHGTNLCINCTCSTHFAQSFL